MKVQKRKMWNVWKKVRTFIICMWFARAVDALLMFSGIHQQRLNKLQKSGRQTFSFWDEISGGMSAKPGTDNDKRQVFGVSNAIVLLDSYLNALHNQGTSITIFILSWTKTLCCSKQRLRRFYRHHRSVILWTHWQYACPVVQRQVSCVLRQYPCDAEKRLICRGHMGDTKTFAPSIVITCEHFPVRCMRLVIDGSRCACFD